MIAVAILRRRLREGKTYEDFRRAWYHGTGFGASNRMLTLLNVADPREVIVVALTETTTEEAAGLIEIDATERGDNPLDDVIEPTVDRTFGVLVSEDDFSAAGPIPYRPATVAGEETDMTEIAMALQAAAGLLADYLPPPPSGDGKGEVA
ncbi:MAG TPA: hypothetical protein VHA76_15770 [Solirubrobacterales bacterium]|nr:hypothetical protein [Solirubrobacterales bacterium]